METRCTRMTSAGRPLVDANWQPRCRRRNALRPVALRHNLSIGLPCFSVSRYALADVLVAKDEFLKRTVALSNKKKTCRKMATVFMSNCRSAPQRATVARLCRAPRALGVLGRAPTGDLNYQRHSHQSQDTPSARATRSRTGLQGQELHARVHLESENLETPRPGR